MPSQLTVSPSGPVAPTGSTVMPEMRAFSCTPPALALTVSSVPLKNDTQAPTRGRVEGEVTATGAGTCLLSSLKSTSILLVLGQGLHLVAW